MAAAVASKPAAAPTIGSCLSNPLDVVQASFATASAGAPEQWEAEVEEGMRSLFATPEAVARIPSLNDTPVDQLRPGTLVRYRCMVQDVQDPEYYLGVFQHTNVVTGEKSVATAKYRDAIPPQAVMLEGTLPAGRQPLYCVPIPGETAWAAAAHASAGAAAAAAPLAAVSRSKRRGMDSEDEMEPVVQPSPPRQRGQAASATAAGPVAVGPVAAGMAGAEPGMAGAEPAKPAGAAPAATALPRRESNRPIAGSGGVPCLVKVYDEAGNSIRVHETFEFVGVLSVAPEPSFAGACAPCNGDGAATDDWADGIENTVPYSELPRRKHTSGPRTTT